MSEIMVGITIPSGNEIAEQTSPLERKVAALEIVDAASHAVGLEIGKRIRSLQKFVTEMHAEPKKRFSEGHKAVIAQEKRYLLPLEKTQGLLSAKLTAYEIAARQRAEDEARERQKAAQKVEEERTLAEALAAEEAGDQALADAIIETPQAAPVVIVEPELAQVDGASSRMLWSAEIVELLALVKYVATNPEHLGLLQPNQTALNGMARALKDHLRIPGVRVVSTISRAYRSE